MKHSHRKSDRPIVPKKPSNKVDAGVSAAERVEGRGLAKGNPQEQNRSRAQHRNELTHALERIRKAIKRDKKPEDRPTLGCDVKTDAATKQPSDGSGCIRSSIDGCPLPTSPIPILNIALALLPEAGARCGNSARRDLCGGRGATRVPTATSP